MLVVVDVLGYPVHCVPVRPDVDLVSADLRTRVFDHLLHVVLTGPVIVYDEAQPCIHLIVVLKFGIKFISLLFEGENFVLLGSDVSLEFLNLVVQHKFELLEFLGFLF